MMAPDAFPDEPTGPFEPPPQSFDDGQGRTLELRRYGEALDDVGAERRALVAMYDTFDPADRAQGIPPSNEPAVREWLDGLLVEAAIHVLAWDADAVAGHAILVPDQTGAYELAIFVHQDYQGAGVGTRLIRALLGAGAEAGIERVWLTVERWNRPAIALYKGVGFETTEAASFDLEMALRLAPIATSAPSEDP